MTGEQLTYWLAVVVPPVASFSLNWVVRGTKALKSAGADWLLLLLAFDLTGVFTIVDLAKHVQSPDVRSNLMSLLVCSALLSLVLWLVVALRLEPILDQKSSGGWDSLRKILGVACAWFFVIVLFAAHVALFTMEQGA